MFQVSLEAHSVCLSTLTRKLSNLNSQTEVQVLLECLLIQFKIVISAVAATKMFKGKRHDVNFNEFISIGLLYLRNQNNNYSRQEILATLWLSDHVLKYQRLLLKCNQWAVGCWGRLCACPYISCQWRRSLSSQKCPFPVLICCWSASAEYHWLLADVALRSVRCYLEWTLPWQAWRKRRSQVAHITLGVPHHIIHFWQWTGHAFRKDLSSSLILNWYENYLPNHLL